MINCRITRWVTLFAVMTIGVVCPTAPSRAIVHSSQTPPQESAWLAYGDSISVGLGATEPSLSFVERVAGELNVHIDNRAVGGSRMAEQLQVIQGYSGSATNVIWLVGYNDMRAGTDVDDFAMMLQEGLTFLTQRHIRVYLGLCLRMTQEGYLLYGPQWNHGSDNAVLQLNQRIRQVADQYPDVVLVEMDRYEPAIAGSGDLVHPGDLGHLQIALDFMDKIVRLIPLPAIYARALTQHQGLLLTA